MKIKRFYSAIIYLILALAPVFFSPRSASAEGFCGIPAYQATIGENAKECADSYPPGTFSCENNGAWGCNGKYSCDSENLRASCAWRGNAGDCDVDVWDNSADPPANRQTGCYITEDRTGCTPLFAPKTGSCWVTGGVTGTPTPRPPVCRDALGDHWPSGEAGRPACGVFGWAAPKDYSSYSAPLDVDIYIDGVFFRRMTANGSEYINCSQNPAPAQCGHGFAYTFTPDDLSYGTTHEIRVKAPDSCGNYETISNSPRDITCATPTPAPDQPNCSNLTGPSSIILGQSGTYSANFYSPQGALGAEIFYDNFNSIIYQTLTDYLSAVWTPPAAGVYKVRCRAWNDAIAECRPGTMGPFTPPVYECVGPSTEITVNVITPTPTPTPAMVDVRGKVYDSQVYTSNGLGQCTKPDDGSGINPNPGQNRVEVKNTAGAGEGNGGEVQGSGEYQVVQVPLLTGSIKNISLTGIGDNYTFVCPGGGVYSAANVNPAAGGNPVGWDFVVSSILGKWSQVIGGHVHGQAGATVTVPAANYFLIPGSFTNGKSGVGSKVSGNFNTLPGGLSASWSLLTDGINLSTWRYSYQRLWVRAGSPTALLPGDGYNKPPAGFYRKIGDLDIDGGWTGLSGNTVIFADGDVNIKSKITLANDSDFFAVIASGDITVDPAVGHPVKAIPGTSDADLTGVFLAGGNWNGCPAGCSTDKQLVVYGTIAADFGLAGTGSVNFNRDLGAGNNTGPGVSVIWNPNLLLNWPSQLSDALTDWREVAP